MEEFIGKFTEKNMMSPVHCWKEIKEFSKACQ